MFSILSPTTSILSIYGKKITIFLIVIEISHFTIFFGNINNLSIQSISFKNSMAMLGVFMQKFLYCSINTTRVRLHFSLISLSQFQLKFYWHYSGPTILSVSFAFYGTLQSNGVVLYRIYLMIEYLKHHWFMPPPYQMEYVILWCSHNTIKLLSILYQLPNCSGRLWILPSRSVAEVTSNQCTEHSVSHMHLHVVLLQ